MSIELRRLVAEKGPVVDETVDRLAGTSVRVDTLVTRVDVMARQYSAVAARAQAFGSSTTYVDCIVGTSATSTKPVTCDDAGNAVSALNADNLRIVAVQ